MPSDGPRPEFSVIIPTWNRVETLAKMLRAWELQVPTDLEFEVVVVDDGSEDETQALLEAIRPERYQLVRLRQENRGPAMARNYGLAAAMGEKILFTGDDIEPSPDLLRAHHEAHSLTIGGRWAVLGNISWPTDLEITSTMRHVDGIGAQQFSFHYMKDGEEYDYRHFYTSNVSAARKLIDEEFMGFSGDFPAAAFEDAEFSFRLRRRGMKIVYREAARAFHHHAYEVPSFFRRQVSCGRMAAVLIGKWPRTGRDIGAQQVFRSRIRERLTFGAKRGRIDGIRGRLDDLEKAAIDLAARFDRPATDAVDPLLEKLFRYGYLKGLVFGLMRDDVAQRLCAFWFNNLVFMGVEAFRRELESRGRQLDDSTLRAVLD